MSSRPLLAFLNPQRVGARLADLLAVRVIRGRRRWLLRVRTIPQARSRQPRVRNTRFHLSCPRMLAHHTPAPRGKCATAGYRCCQPNIIEFPRLWYLPYELYGIASPMRMNASAAATLRNIELRRRLARHGYLADGNDLPQQSAGTARAPAHLIMSRCETIPSLPANCELLPVVAHIGKWDRHIRRTPVIKLNRGCHPLESRLRAFMWLSVRSNVT